MDLESLQKRIADIDSMVVKNIITPERADVWKSRIIDEFESKEIPEESRKKMPKDLAHLPGRIIEGAIDVGKAFVKGSGSTYVGLSKQEGYMNSDGTENKNRKQGKSVVDLYEDLYRR